MLIPRGEYPRPQFVREDWLCLNGEWEFEIDTGDDGLVRGMLHRSLKARIIIPFCPESVLSGIGNTDFMDAVWYRRTVTIPSAWAGRDLLLHFQAIDYDATVWVNAVEVARHRGGWCGFTCDLSGIPEAGKEITIVVRARDPRDKSKPSGKQSRELENRGCYYTRTTGIWQTVWMEPVPEIRLNRPRLTPDVTNGVIRLVQPITNSRPGTSLRATLRDTGVEICTASVPADTDFLPRLDLPIPLDRRRFWEPGSPHLYDLRIELLNADGDLIDHATSYAALRSVTIDGIAVKINGKAVFQRLVLDQGHYPDGILTAPSDEALREDIELGMAAGFNGARLHQKVFEERFLYHADSLGYLVWGEFGDWGIDRDNPPATYITQWLEMLQRDYSHPCIVGWCPLNEMIEPISDRITELTELTRGMFLATKAMDTTRPVIDVSGFSHRLRETDIFDIHDYTQETEEFRKRIAQRLQDRSFVDEYAGAQSVPYAGQPCLISEFGGIWWNEPAARTAATGYDRSESWGYGRKVRNIEEFYDRFEKLCNALLDDPRIFGYCYTQLTDVFQEQNGIYDFSRREKFDTSRIAAIQRRPAAIEKNGCKKR